MAVCAPIPGFGLTAQLANISDPASSQALAAEKTDLYLGLIQPASMSGRVVDREAIPQPSTNLFPKAVSQRPCGCGCSGCRRPDEWCLLPNSAWRSQG